MKKYKPIKFKDNESIRFMKNNSRNKCCFFCDKEIGINNIVLTINYVIYFHIRCIIPFCRALVKFKRENLKELMLDKLGV